MKVKLNYVPWKVSLKAGYRNEADGEKLKIPHDRCSSEPGALQKIHDRIRSWKKFPVYYGAGADRHSVFVLLDRIEKPSQLLDQNTAMLATQERIKPGQLPKDAAELYQRLVDLGHASPDGGPDASPEIGGEA